MMNKHSVVIPSWVENSKNLFLFLLIQKITNNWKHRVNRSIN